METGSVFSCIYILLVYRYIMTFCRVMYKLSHLFHLNRMRAITAHFHRWINICFVISSLFTLSTCKVDQGGSGSLITGNREEVAHSPMQSPRFIGVPGNYLPKGSSDRSAGPWSLG